ncbi:MAG: TetR/AcrR family transcriptional regulator [Desertimonas sp.]
MAVKEPSTRKGRRTRQALIEAAFDLFNEAGSAEVRVADISLRAGLSPAAFYRYFDAKDEVLGEVLDLFTGRLSAAVRGHDEDRHLPPFERFSLANRRYVDVYARYGQILRIVERLLVGDESMRAARRDLREAFVPRLRRTLERLRDTGEVTTDLDLGLASAALSTMVQRVSWVMLVLEERQEIHPRMMETIDLLWANALGLDTGGVGVASGSTDELRAWAASSRLPAAEPPPERDPLTSRKGRVTRESLMVAARRVFERDGFLAARVADITKAAAVSHGTFYNYFDSRLDVFHQLMRQLHDDLIVAMRNAGGGGRSSAFVRIRNGNRAFVDFYRDNARFIAVLEQMATVDAHLARLRLDLRDRFVTANHRMMVELQAAGLADRRLDPFATGTALVSMVERMSFTWFVLGVPAPPEAADRLSLVWARAIRLPLRGVRRPRPLTP